MICCPKCKSKRIYIKVDKFLSDEGYLVVYCYNCDYVFEHCQSIDLNSFISENEAKSAFSTKVDVEEFDAYIIHAQTGCTCCNNDNFIEGIFKTIEEARQRRNYHIENRTLASQYAKNGIYTIYKVHCIKYEDSNGIIVDHKYFENKDFKEQCTYYCGNGEEVK